MRPTMTKLTFLGTGGGRFSTLFQARGTGGLYLEDGAARLHIDPGPGALLKLHGAGLDPTDTTGVLVTHAHLDHCNDANLLIEGMTRGGTERRGFLCGSVSVVEGYAGQPPVVTPHHRELCATVHVAKPGGNARVSGVRVEFLATDHRDPTNVGFKFHTSGGVLTYYTDSILRDDLVKPIEGTRVLVLGVTRPRGAPIPGHLTTDDAAAIADRVRPELLVLTHLGLKVLRGGPDGEASYVQDKTGVPTVAARDLTTVTLDEDGVSHKHPASRPKPRGKPRRGRGRRHQK